MADVDSGTSAQMAFGHQCPDHLGISAQIEHETPSGHQCPDHPGMAHAHAQIIRASVPDKELELKNKERRRQGTADSTPKVEEVVVVVSEFCRKAEKAVELARSKLNLSDAEIRERVAVFAKLPESERPPGKLYHWLTEVGSFSMPEPLPAPQHRTSDPWRDFELRRNRMIRWLQQEKGLGKPEAIAAADEKLAPLRTQLENLRDERIVKLA